MSTRAVYGFKDDHGTFWVYVHHDGYPTGAAIKFVNTTSAHRWELPRFEANEFAAGFVAANKTSQGGVRLTSGPDAHGDIEYIYEINQPLPKGPLHIQAAKPDEAPFFSGPLTDFIMHAREIELALRGE